MKLEYLGTKLPLPPDAVADRRGRQMELQVNDFVRNLEVNETLLGKEMQTVFIIDYHQITYFLRELF